MRSVPNTPHRTGSFLLMALVVSMTVVLVVSLLSLIHPTAIGAEDPSARPVDLALIDAAWANDVEQAAELISAGADVNAKDHTVQSAYLVATSEGYLELLELTLDHGADVGSLDWYDGTGLIRSAERGHWPVVGRLLQAGIDPDHVNRLGWTALHEAIILGDGSADYVDTVRLLIAGGADLDLPTGSGEHPLELARLDGQSTIETALRRALENELQVAPDVALLAAIEEGDADTVAVAIREGARVDAIDDAGTAAIDLAETTGAVEIVRILSALGAIATKATVDVATTATEGAGEEVTPDRIDEVHLAPKPEPGPFRMNLFSRGDFVHQRTEYWCIAASAQTMMNIMEDGKPRRSRGFQRRLHFEARDLYQGDDRFWRRIAGESRWKAGLHGLGLRDWAGVLETSGYGGYDVARAPTRKRAIRMAAKAIRRTGRPAGLVVWRGAHAWVMSGFVATADPAYTDEFRVTKVFIQDPWYPNTSSIWGTSRPPNSVVPVADLAEDYLRYKRPAQRQPGRDGKYMLVLPQHERAAAATSGSAQG